MSATPESGPDLAPCLVRLRIRGFRSYGTDVCEVELDSPITVIKGDNSQGKTATAEALEFLFTGCSSRRDLFGGAKAEDERMLANVHLPTDDSDVWVEAEVRCPDGVIRSVRRTLAADYSASTECVSTVSIDGRDVEDIDVLGIPFSDPPLAAPVLLQHNLRYVLSTEPQKRAAYFRSLLELTDLDVVGDAVKHAKDKLANLPVLPWVAALSALTSSVEGNAAAVAAVGKATRATDQSSLTAHLITTAKAISPAVTGSSADDVIAELQQVKAQAEERVFPIGALTPNLAQMPATVDTTRLGQGVDTYTERLRAVDAEAARLTPIIDAVLKHPHVGRLSESMRCPVCDDGTLRPERVEQLRQQLASSAEMQEAATAAKSQLQQALEDVDRVVLALMSVLPAAQAWSDREWAETSTHREALRDAGESGAPPLDSDKSAHGTVSRATEVLQRLRDIRGQMKDLVDAAVRDVDERAPVRDRVSPLLAKTNECIVDVHREAESLKALVDSLHEDLGEKLQSAALPVGTREILDILSHRDELHYELRVETQRKRVKQRVHTLGRMIEVAERGLLDDRFDKMGAEIDRWWATLRPDELVRFGGVGRRASGRRYVNLTAELAVSSGSTPQVRDAVGVFSDSQLNALGLAAFLARQRLLSSPVVVLDDPLPGYDPEHRVTFTLKHWGHSWMRASKSSSAHTIRSWPSTSSRCKAIEGWSTMS